MQRHTQTRFDNAVITEEQLQQQITMFKSLKSSWTNHSLCQMIFAKHKKAKQKMLPNPNHPCMGARTLSQTLHKHWSLWNNNVIKRTRTIAKHNLHYSTRNLAVLQWPDQLFHCDKYEGSTQSRWEVSAILCSSIAKNNNPYAHLLLKTII